MASESTVHKKSLLDKGCGWTPIYFVINEVSPKKEKRKYFPILSISLHFFLCFEKSALLELGSGSSRSMDLFFLSASQLMHNSICSQVPNVDTSPVAVCQRTWENTDEQMTGWQCCWCLFWHRRGSFPELCVVYMSSLKGGTRRRRRTFLLAAHRPVLCSCIMMMKHWESRFCTMVEHLQAERWQRHMLACVPLKTAAWSFNLPPQGSLTLQWESKCGVLQCSLRVSTLQDGKPSGGGGLKQWWHQHPLSAGQSLCCFTSIACGLVSAGDLALVYEKLGGTAQTSQLNGWYSCGDVLRQWVSRFFILSQTRTPCHHVQKRCYSSGRTSASCKIIP